jgi:hypothetical protein
MDEKLVKSLTSLIDETIAEIEDLKKSRFSAAEIKLDGPGEDGIAGKPASGDIGKDDDEDDDEDDEKKKKEEAEKAEKEEKEKDDKKKKEDEEAEKADKSECAKGVNEEKDEAKKADDDKKKKKDEDEDEEDEKSKGFEFKKSLEDQESLMKSYVDEKVSGLEKKLADILEVINKIGEQPVSKKGISTVVPLKKNDESAPLAKAEVANKLFELKKSGTYVDSADIAAVETGGDLQVITSKYNLK